MKNASLSLEQIKIDFPGATTTFITNKRSLTTDQKSEQLSFLEIEFEILSNLKD